MEKKSRQSRKQKEQGENDQKRKEYETDYDRLQETIASSSSELLKDLLPTKEVFVEEEINQYKSSKSPFPFGGLYQEPEEQKVIHQEKFIEILCSVSPAIFDELKVLVPTFNALFGSISSVDEFMKEKMKNIFSLQKHPLTALDGFPHNKTTWKIPADFNWQRYKVPFLLAKTVLELEKSDDKKQTQSTPILLPDAVDTWKNELINSQLTDPENWSETIGGYIKKLRKIIIKAFQDTAVDKDLIWENFLTLQSKLYLWMERYEMEKDFVFEYLYIFLYQFSLNENLAVEELKIWRRTYHTRLMSYDFVFPKQDGWWARKESAQNYQSRITKKFKKALDDYLRSSYEYLQLADKKHITKPKDTDFESIYWLVAWNEGATSKQIARCFNKSVDAIKDGINSLKRFNLPKRIDKPGRKKELPVNNQRLHEIRQRFLETKQNERKKKVTKENK